MTQGEEPTGSRDTGDVRKKLSEPGRYASIPHVLLARSGLPAAAKLVWMALAGHLREPGTAVWPSTARLARLTGLSKRTVIRSVRTLEDAGFVDA